MNDVTGRDSYIIAKALAYAIEAISSLPKERQENEEMLKMKKILESMIPDNEQLQYIIVNARRHFTGQDAFRSTEDYPTVD